MAKEASQPEAEPEVVETQEPETQETTAEEPQETTTGDEPQGEPEAEEEAEESWIDDEVLEIADDLGLSEDELEDFEDRRAFNRLVRLFDRQRISASRGQTQPQQPPPQQAPPTQLPAELPRLDPEMFDEPLLKAIEARDQFYLGHIGAMQQQLEAAIGHFQQEQVRKEYQDFEAVLDGLGHKELFGLTGQVAPGSRQARNRQRVLDAYAYLPNRRATPAMVRRAVYQEFWSDLEKSQRSARAEKLRAQNKKVLRTGKSRTAPSPASDDGKWGISEAAEEELVRKFQRAGY